MERVVSANRTIPPHLLVCQIAKFALSVALTCGSSSTLGAPKPDLTAPTSKKVTTTQLLSRAVQSEIVRLFSVADVFVFYPEIERYIEYSRFSTDAALQKSGFGSLYSEPFLYRRIPQEIQFLTAAKFVGQIESREKAFAKLASTEYPAANHWMGERLAVMRARGAYLGVAKLAQAEATSNIDLALSIIEKSLSTGGPACITFDMQGTRACLRRFGEPLDKLTAITELTDAPDSTARAQKFIRAAATLAIAANSDFLVELQRGEYAVGNPRVRSAQSSIADSTAIIQSGITKKKADDEAKASAAAAKLAEKEERARIEAERRRRNRENSP